MHTAAELLTNLSVELEAQSGEDPQSVAQFSVQTAQQQMQTMVDQDETHVNILDYIKASWGPTMVPYPAQRFLLKCFSGKTRAWVDGSLQRLEDSVGPCEVLSADGGWRKAEIKCFGRQDLQTLLLRPASNNRTKFRRAYRVTKNHRWVLADGTETENIRLKDRVRVVPRKADKESEDYKEGFAHGFVFGDGSESKYKLADGSIRRGRHYVRLCGAKDQRWKGLLESRPGYVSTTFSPSCSGEPVVTVWGEQSWKEVPKEGKSSDYLAGFCDGWIEADGGRHKHCNTSYIDSTSWEELKWMADRATQAGYVPTGLNIYGDDETNLGKRTRKLKRLSLSPVEIDYVVCGMEDSGAEEVFCAVEPETKTFQLEGGVPTGNCIYKLPLDGKVKDIEIWDRSKQMLHSMMHEKEFIKFLYDENRCNVTEDDVMDPEMLFPTVNLVLGRRGTKTTTCGWIASYECYKLLRIRDPQRYFGISPDNSIGLILVSTGKDLATDLFQGIAAVVERSPFFKPYIAAPLKRSIKLSTRASIEAGVASRVGIMLQAMPCSAKSLRGPQRLMAIMDEYGHFTVEMSGQDRSDRSIWDAVQPSTADLTHPDGTPAGRMFSISTPLTRETHLYQLLQQGLADRGKTADERSGILTFNMPSVWINKKINVYVIRQAYAENSEKADQEYGAVFSDKVTSAFRNVDFQSNARTGPTILTRSRALSFMGIDIGGLSKGPKRDGCSWHICHYEGNQKVSTFHDYWDPEKLNVKFPLDFEKIADHTVKLWREYKCHFGIYDQWNGYGLQALLRQRSMREWTGRRGDPMIGLWMVTFTDTLNSRMWKYVIDTAEAGQTIVYDDDLIKELYGLQRYEVGKDKIKVECASLAHHHDDRGDAWARALWSAKLFYDENPRRLADVKTSYHQQQQRKEARQRLIQHRRGAVNPRTGDPRIEEKRSMRMRMRKITPRTVK